MDRILLISHVNICLGLLSINSKGECKAFALLTLLQGNGASQNRTFNLLLYIQIASRVPLPAVLACMELEGESVWQ